MGLVCGNRVSAVVCTRSEALAERLRSLLLRWARSECVRLSVETEASLSQQDDRNSALLFLDMDSVELPEKGRPELTKGALIVISRDAGRAIHSYRWHPAAFLKPDFNARRLAEALNDCERHWQKGRDSLESPYRRRVFRMPLGRIRYVEASAHYCMFSQGKQFIRFRYGVNELEDVLPKPPFVRCHRSYLVHLDAVEGINYTTLTLHDGVTLPMGRTYIESMREALRLWQEGELPHDDLHTGM